MYNSEVEDDHGELVGAVIVFRDVTQRREADEKLRSALAEVDRLRARLELENAYLQEEIRLTSNHRGVIGQSAAIQQVLQQVDLVAPTDAAVLITGEAGTGKETIARTIHEEPYFTTGPRGAMRGLPLCPTNTLSGCSMTSGYSRITRQMRSRSGSVPRGGAQVSE